MKKPPSLPVAMDGAIFENVGKYARGAVLYAFERVGGPEALATWAKDNPDDFYTKLFPKIITRETEVHHHKSVDDLMDVLDGDYEVADAPQPAPAGIERGFDDPADLSPREREMLAGDEWDLDDYVDFPDE